MATKPVPVDLIDRLRTAGCVFAEDEAALLIDAAGSVADLERMVVQRVGGQPLEQVLGWVEFCGRRFRVAPGVFVPRQRTTALVERAAELVRPGNRVLDLCCGVGAIGAALTDRVAGLQLVASDIDPVAVDCARLNLTACSGRVYCGDLYSALPAQLAGSFDLIVVNAPYVPTSAIATMPTEARDHEPMAALDGGSDGLEVHRRVFSEASRWLAPGGRLLIEASAAQAPVSAASARAAGLTGVTVWRDEERDETVVVARMAPAHGNLAG